MPMTSLSRSQFLEMYEFDAEREFELDGQPARWADGTSGPRFWGEESAIITLKEPVDPVDDEKHRLQGDMALSPNERYLAVAMDRVIYIYRTDSRTLSAQLVGHLRDVRMLCFSPCYTTQDGPMKRDRYLLLSQADGPNCSSRDGETIAWHLDADGRQVLEPRAMPFAIENMADKAISAITEDLHIHHDLSDEEVLTIRKSIAGSLKVADAQNRAQYLSKAEGMHWTRSYQHSGPFNSDGKQMVTVTTPTTTSSDDATSRSDRNSVAVILDTETLEEKCRLEGHTDNIIWADWSREFHHPIFRPGNDKAIATASWDGTYKIWNPETGECRQTIKPNDRQQWVGHFSPDGEYILFSGSGDEGHVNIYRTETAEKVATLPAPEGGKLANWIRKLSWHPRDHGIALENRQSVLFWDWKNGRVDEIFKLREHEERILSNFARICDLVWMEQGRKLAVQWSDGTFCIWDKEENVKWRIQRPKSAPGGYMVPTVQYLMHQHTILSLDGDRKIRYWRL